MTPEITGTEVFLSYVWYKAHQHGKTTPMSYAEFVDDCVMPAMVDGKMQMVKCPFKLKSGS